VSTLDGFYDGLLIRHYILESRVLFLHGAKGVVLFDHELKPKIYELKGGGGSLCHRELIGVFCQFFVSLTHFVFV